jgi:hypothetical protein
MPILGGDLMTEQQEILSDEAQVLADPPLQPHLEVQLRRREPLRLVALNAPELHLD